jgi:thiamine pyrophosphate-dependent acetolactate synthase large subunit-like protein
MASTAIQNEEEKKEYFDSPEELKEKVERLAMMILNAEHFVSFTGAGISTAAGIADYRSGANTVLPTGAGCREKAAAIEKARKAGTMVNLPN